MISKEQLIGKSQCLNYKHEKELNNSCVYFCFCPKVQTKHNKKLKKYLVLKKSKLFPKCLKSDVTPLFQSHSENISRVELIDR